MKLFVVVALLSVFSAVKASAAPCVAVAHTIAAEPEGFVPNKMYFCVDSTKPATNDKIYIQNDSGRTITIKYKALNGTDVYTSTIGKGAKSPALTSPGNGAISAVVLTTQTYCTQSSWWTGCTAYETRTTESSVYSASNAGALEIGVAPNSY